MDLSWAQGILDWLSANPGWTTFFIFFVAMAEGVVIAGILVPGSTLLFISGALVGTGHIELWPSLIAAFLGALLGDSTSYWLGRHYGERLRMYWPLNRYPEALAKGDEFFAVHGGKSLVFGRFVGPVRGIIPAVAGMMGMALRPFLLVNLFSALFWAPAYLLPGVVFGASLTVAASVAVRLVALVLLALGVVWVGWWLLRRVVAPRLRSSAALLAWRARNWGRFHPLAAQALSGPRYALRAFSYSAGWIWWAALVGFLSLLAIHLVRQRPTLLDEALLGIMAVHIDTAWRSYFILPAQLLELLVWAPALLVGVLWTAFAGRWRVAVVLASIVVGSVLVALLVQWATGSWGSPPIYRGAPVLALPSFEVAGFTTLLLGTGVLATAVYGAQRGVVRIAGVVIALLAALSGVIVGRFWFSDALAGLLLGVVMAGLVIMARSFAQRRVPERALPAVVGAVLVVTVAIHTVIVFPHERERFVAQAGRPQVSVFEWLRIGPVDLLGRELRWLDGGKRPVDIQWLAREQTVVESLDRAGWVEPERGLHGVLRWFQPQPKVQSMLPLVRWHRGRMPEFIRVLAMDAKRRLVLRIWRAPVAVAESDKNVWLVTLEQEEVQEGWPIARVGSSQPRAVQREAVVNDLLREDDLRILEPGQPVRIVPLPALQ